MTARQPAVPFILVTVFLDVIGFGLIIPVLPALIGDFTASRDQQAYWFGALTAAYGLMQFGCAPLLGALSDRFGRRPVLLLSIFGLGCDFLLMALAPNLWVLLLARLLGGATGANFSVANAYIADVTPPEQRGRGFGALGAAFGLGFIVGPMLGGLLGATDVRLPFYVAAGLSLLNAAYGLFVLPESHPVAKRVAFSFARANPFSALWSLAQLRGVGSLIAVYTLFMLAQFVLHATWVLYTTFRFDWTPRENGISLFIVGLVGAVVQGVLLGRLMRHWGERRLVYIGFASGAIAYVAYGLATEGWMMYCIIFANLLSFAAAPALQAQISKAVSPEHQGVAMGSLSSISSLMLVVAPLLASPLLARVSHLPSGDWRIGATFFLSAGLQALALLMAVVHFRRHPLPHTLP
ncbi:TCR/Tet family MFS transporter [Chitiniphilus shinanonensis]|uniref:TCR/Tet family MFS transporter n=1 Tax=Chitiniphilus shinanonensis TaxID=553088 RepID=UPI00305EF3D6